MDYKWLQDKCCKEYSRYALMFCIFFFIRCTFIKFGIGSVRAPWIIDVHYYFGAILGVILVVPLLAIVRERYDVNDD